MPRRKQPKGATLTAGQMFARLDAAIAQAGSLRAFAKQAKVSAAYVSDVRLRRRAIGPKLAKALGTNVSVTRHVITEHTYHESGA